MKYLISAMAIVCSAITVSAQTPAPTNPFSAKIDFRPDPLQPAAKEGPTIGEQIAELKAQTAEMRRSEDRLLQMVLWSLGTIGTVAALITGASLFTARTMHERDVQRVKGEVSEEIKVVIANHMSTVQTRLLHEIEVKNNYNRAELLALFLGHIADIRLSMQSQSTEPQYRREHGNAVLNAAMEMISNARGSNTNLIQAAEERIIKALALAVSHGQSLGKSQINDAKTLVQISQNGQTLQDYLSRHDRLP